MSLAQILFGPQGKKFWSISVRLGCDHWLLAGTPLPKKVMGFVIYFRIVEGNNIFLSKGTSINDI